MYRVYNKYLYVWIPWKFEEGLVEQASLQHYGEDM